MRAVPMVATAPRRLELGLKKKRRLLRKPRAAKLLEKP